MIDSHCHLLEERFDSDREELIAGLGGAGVSAVIEAGTNLADSVQARDLSRAHPMIYFLAGVHPHEAAGVPENYLGRLGELYRDEKCLGIGEIGLDYHYDFSPRAVQLRVFDEQLSLAKALSAPVCIHSREATQHVLEGLARYRGEVIGVLHCFSGSVETAKACLDLGYYISFAGPVTFKNANKLLDVAKMVPDDRILIETDSPYLAPVPMRGKRNQPAFVAHTLDRLCELRNQNREALERLTEENTQRLYGKMVK